MLSLGEMATEMQDEVKSRSCPWEFVAVEKIV
jgi:hypothetical protein